MSTIKYDYDLTAADDFNLVNAATHTLSDLNKYAFYHIIDSTCADPYLYHNIVGDCNKVTQLLSKPAEKMFLDSVFFIANPEPVWVFPDTFEGPYKPYEDLGELLGKNLVIRIAEVLAAEDAYANLLKTLTTISEKHPDTKLTKIMANLDKITTVLDALRKLCRVK